MVIDWRAPVSLPFYRATRADADGRRAPAPVRLPARDADVVRGRGPHRSAPGPAIRLLRHPRAGDRAAARRADARHRRHHPARAGRDRPLRPVAVDLRAGRSRHRQDGRRPAPGGVPAVRPPRAADPPGRDGGRAPTPASCATSATCCRRWARSTRRSRRSPSWPSRSLRERQREVVDPRRRARVRGHAQGRRADGRGAVEGAVVSRDHARPRGSSCRAVRGGGGWRRTRSRRSSPRCATAACGTAPRGRWCRRRWPTGSWCGWSWRATPRTTGCRTPSPAASRSRTTPPRCGRPSTRPGSCGGCCPTPSSSPPPPTGLLSEDEQALLSWTRAAEEPGVDAVDPGRGDPGRRGRRPGRADRLGRAHRGRRGAGPLPHDAAGAGPPFLDRVADRARRPGPGHHALGDPLVGRGPRPPRQARRPRRAADPRLPGARRGHRVRRPPAARDRARASSRRRPSVARAASWRWSHSPRSWTSSRPPSPGKGRSG